MAEQTIQEKAVEVGTFVGRAIASDVVAWAERGEDIEVRWGPLAPQADDRLAAAGIRPGQAEWREAARAAKRAYLAAIAEAGLDKAD